MKNPNIGRMLKYYRKMKHFSVNEVADIFKANHHEIATKTIYGWESGQTQPNADDLMFLCSLYEIDNILETFGYTSDPREPIILTELERKLILSYRQNIAFHPAIHKLLDLEK